MKNRKVVIISLCLVVVLVSLIFLLVFNMNKIESTMNIKTDKVALTLELDKDDKIIKVTGDNNELSSIKGKDLKKSTKVISNYIADKTSDKNINMEITYSGKVDVDEFKEDLEKELEEKDIDTTITKEEQESKNQSKSNTNTSDNKYACDFTLEYDAITYDGTEKKPQVKVTCNKEILKESLYTVTYKNNKNAGNAKVTIKVNGKYNQELSDTFEIRKKEAVLGTCTYPRSNGKEQSIISGGEGVKYTNNIKKEIGNYEVVATLDNNYYWSDTASKTKKINCSINMTSNNNPTEIYFINTTNASLHKYSNEAILIVTRDGRTAVIDTSDNPDYPNIIYTYLKQIQNKDIVTIDHLIISHPHTDHYYGLKFISKTTEYDNRIKIKNIYYKANTYNETREGLTTLINTLKNRKIIDNVISVTNMQENTIIDLDNYNSLHLFNLNDSFSGIDCAFTGTIKSIGFRKYSSSKNTSDLICSNSSCNKYYYINIDEPHTIKKDASYDNTHLHDYWYAYKRDVSADYLCNENTNSIAVLVESKTSSGSKYAYIPSDLENNAYSPIGEHNKYIENSWYSSSIYGNSWFVYDYNFNKVDTICTSTNKCVSLSKYKVASESRVANRICNLLTNNNCKDQAAREQLTNIVIYQQSHHGYNNVLDAVNTLRLNRTDLYSIITTSGTAYRDKTNDFNIARTCAKNSKNTKMRSTGSTTSGFPSNSVGAIRCTIGSNGKTSCDGKPVCTNQNN